jgi:hypothetical protein
MFVLITIFFYDLGYNVTEKQKPSKETTTPSGNLSENDIESIHAD